MIRESFSDVTVQRFNDSGLPEKPADGRTRTGTTGLLRPNGYADKILAALRHAPNGMTKTEISADVFSRHASSAGIDEALRLLHGLAMVGYRVEASGGAPVQRWFLGGETREKSE